MAHKEFSCPLPFAPILSFLKGSDEISAFQSPQWHRNRNRNAIRKSLDCLAWLELRMSSSASGSPIPMLEKHAVDLPNSRCTSLWSPDLLPCFRSRQQKKNATKMSIFTLWNLRVKLRAVKEAANCRVPVLLFIPSHLYSWKEADAGWHVPCHPSIFSSPVWRELQKLLVQWKVNLFYHPHWQVFVRLVISGSLDIIKIQIDHL